MPHVVVDWKCSLEIVELLANRLDYAPPMMEVVWDVDEQQESSHRLTTTTTFLTWVWDMMAKHLLFIR